MSAVEVSARFPPRIVSRTEQVWFNKDRSSQHRRAQLREAQRKHRQRRQDEVEELELRISELQQQVKQGQREKEKLYNVALKSLSLIASQRQETMADLRRASVTNSAGPPRPGVLGRAASTSFWEQSNSGLSHRLPCSPQSNSNNFANRDLWMHPEAGSAIAMVAPSAISPLDDFMFDMPPALAPSEQTLPLGNHNQSCPDFATEDVLRQMPGDEDAIERICSAVASPQGTMELQNLDRQEIELLTSLRGVDGGVCGPPELGLHAAGQAGDDGSCLDWLGGIDGDNVNLSHEAVYRQL
jgi:hypothetical protein